jgi:hypothetical protein
MKTTLVSILVAVSILVPAPASANNREVPDSGPGISALIGGPHGGWHATERLLDR